jgi:uncharacterized protein (DUF427 family)
MGLSWQQGPLGRNPNGRFLAGDLPDRLPFAEPLRRRMSVQLGGATIAESDDVVLLFEPGRYPVAYFPSSDIADGALTPIEHRTGHRDLGATRWFQVRGGDRTVERGAWQHVEPPAYAPLLCDTVAFSWRGMDAFYEEDERILGHASDPYHRIDVRRTSRHLVVRDGDRLVADTDSPLVLYESGFAPRWYVPRADVVADALTAVDGQTFCPYKGVATYYDVGDRRRAAWSYRAPIEVMERIGDLVSFEPDRLDVTIDGVRLDLPPGQTVVAHGLDRDLGVDEAGAIVTAG